MRLRRLSRLAGLWLVMLLLAGPAVAHPADELCGPGSELDPALCRALSELDRADRDPASSIPEEIIVEDLDRSTAETLALYASIGFGHILPDGADHILFVLAIFLSTRRLRGLLWQVSAFTLAHTVTLGLTSAGVISPPPEIVDPLIAATIAFVAIENLVFREMTHWRPAVVFGFGLIHGMAFADAFGGLGLPAGLFWTSLIGFNIGVELGQLAVLAMAMAAGLGVQMILASADRPQLYRPVFSWPLSALIGAFGLWWLLLRLVPAGT